VTAGRNTVAVRVPAHVVAQRLLQACPFPVAAPSANRSGYISPTLAEHVCDASGLGDWVSLVIDGGPCIHGVESTIVQLGDRPRLLRPGSITVAQLADRLGICVSELQSNGVLETTANTASLLAPGMMREHYAPTTPLVLLRSALTAQNGDGEVRPSLNAVEHEHAVGGRLGRIAFRPLPAPEAARYFAVETLSDRGDLADVARHLFAALRRLDAAGLALIHCDTCPPEGLGQAIMDRLERAAAKTEPGQDGATPA
jgi:L-threonylcarbamoyladenylate synthase